MKTWRFFGLLFACVLAARLCHNGVLWEPETFPMAAAAQMLHGKVLYRDIWYDKPPLAALFYLLIGAKEGWLLRVTGALYVLLASYLSFRFAGELWDRGAGFRAAGLMAFFLTFDIAASVLPIGPDLLMVAPHLLAVWMAWRGRMLWSGVAAGIAFLCNVKGLFVLAVCCLFGFPGIGFVSLVAAAAGFLYLSGAWPGYLAQVWVWSSAYAGSSFVANPWTNGLARTANWLGFHVALVCGSIYRMPWRLLAWLAISFVAVALGLRFFPRYYLQLLPPLVILASRLNRRAWCLAALLLIPLVRFGPRYVEQAIGQHWNDTAMDSDSRAAATLVRNSAQPGDTLFIWGYRPELWVYTGLPDATRFLDSQPLTGVPADRHLTQSQPIAETHPALRELALSKPTILVDGLSAYNPRLAPALYPELQEWFAHYRLVARTATTLVYRRYN